MISLNCRGRVTDVAHALINLWFTKEGRSISSIARDLHLARSTVRCHIGNIPPSQKKMAAPPQLSTSKRRAMDRRRKLVKEVAQEEIVIKKNGYLFKKRVFNSATAIRLEVMRRSNFAFRVCISTIQNDLKSVGAVCRKRPKGPMLHDGDDEKRKAFCRQNIIPASSILFSDEKYFDCQDHGQPFQWCLDKELPHRRSIERFSPKVHVWGLIGIDVKVLVLLGEDMINSANYISQCLSPNIGVLKTKVFMQDGARAHTAHATGQFLESKGVNVLKGWPARSPELNPIENLWSVLQSKVSDLNPTTTEEVRQAVQQAWRSISQAEVNRLVLSFDRRIASCLAENGGTKHFNFRSSVRVKANSV